MNDEGGRGGESRPTDQAAALSTVEPGLLDEKLIVSGTINIRKTHPNLYLGITTFALIDVALGLCFSFFHPTFPVYGMPYQLWGVIYLALGISQLVFLNFYRRLTGVRVTMVCSIIFALFFGFGTLQPVFEGNASPQLMILYAGIAALQIPLVLEPFINPWTARRD